MSSTDEKILQLQSEIKALHEIVYKNNTDIIELKKIISAQSTDIDNLKNEIQQLSQLNKQTSSLQAVMIMYNAEADREIFSSLRMSGIVKHYIKWEKVKGTGSGGMSVIGALEENSYCVVLIILPIDKANQIYNDILELRQRMIRKTGMAALIFKVEKIG